LSPDARTLLFTRRVPGQPAHIYSLDLQTNAIRQITDDAPEPFPRAVPRAESCAAPWGDRGGSRSRGKRVVSRHSCAAPAGDEQLREPFAAQRQPVEVLLRHAAKSFR
jgi:hypothetical protein